MKIKTAVFLFLGGALFLKGAWIPVKAELAQYLLKSAWENTLMNNALDGTDENQIFKPWPWADTWPVGKLVIPKLNHEWIVLEGASGRNLAFGPTHLSSSVKVGIEGVSVISGHRDTSFSILEEVTTGDRLLWQTPGGEWLEYEIANEMVANSKEAFINLEAYQEGENTLILTTCFPFGESTNGPLRKLFEAYPVDTSA